MLCVNHQLATLYSGITGSTSLETFHPEFSQAQFVTLYSKEFTPERRSVLCRNKKALKSFVTNLG